MLAPAAAQAAERFVVADFDGDGQHDSAAFDRVEPSVLRIWLSTTRSTAILRSRMPIVGIAARDLDGDRRAELIAGSTSSELQVWTERRKSFRKFDRRPVAPVTLEPPLRHRVQDAPDDPPVAIAPHAISVALAPSARPRAPAPTIACWMAPCDAGPHAFRRFAPLSPRPPPRSR